MIARFRGVALTCDVCGDQYVDLTDVRGLIDGDASPLVDALVASARREGWQVEPAGQVGCPEHRVATIRGGRQTDLFGGAAA